MVTSNLAYKTQLAIDAENEVKENPIKWCSISLSNVVAHEKRLEASVYDIEAKQARETIMNGKYSCVPLLGECGLIDKAYYPGRFKRIYCEKENGEAFFTPSQMADIYPKSDKYISKLTKCDLTELKLKPNTLLLTRSGTIGTISLVSKTIGGKVFSDDVIRVTFNNIIDLGYCYAFLKSKIGNIMLQTNGYGSVITHLEPEHLSEIYIPNAPNNIKERIHSLVMRSFELRDESNGLIDKATTQIVEELRLPDIENFDVSLYKKEATVDNFSVKLSEISGRLDASYHVPLVDAIINHMGQYAEEVTTIGDPRISKDVILPGRFKRTYVDEEYGYILLGGKQIYELDPSNKKYLSKSKHKKIMSKLEISENTILLTRSGTIGKVNIAPKHWVNLIPSEHIIRIVPKNENIAGYLYIFLSTDYGKELITRYTYGSVVDEIDDNHVRQIKIPLLKDHDIQKQINSLALKANEKRFEAYQLEQKALKIMNESVIYAK